MAEVQPLIRTKLRVPYTRPELVPRPRLREKMAQGLRAPLTLVAAPAGFGKTTLVASALAGWEGAAAWLSLEKEENDVGRFLGYLLAALQAEDGRVGEAAAPLLTARPVVPVVALLTILVNDLEGLGREFVLVLDDYHLIESAAVHQAVAFLLEHAPRGFHLIISTRSDPPLPLARLRARGQLLTLRAADLRFCGPEVDHFLNEVMGLELDAGAVRLLEARTEGWIAGLQMAGLALSRRGGEEAAAFVAHFSGTNRYILDYLVEEVLSGEPPAIRHFLLHTSILEQLSAPLCAALLGADGGEAATTLAYLERANLFLVPLDDERSWYRYHHLFADLLRAQLQRTVAAGEVVRLHVRAAEWHGAHGSVLAAIEHASQAGDEARIERFVEQNYMELLTHGEQAGLRSWTGKLDEALVLGRPRLAIYQAFSHSWFGELAAAERLLVEAETRLAGAADTPEVRGLRGLLAYVKSRVTALRGDVAGAIDLCLQARALIPAGNPALALDTAITLGYEYYLQGDLARAAEILAQTVADGRRSGAVINTVAAACVLARLRAVQGRLGDAEATYALAGRAIPDTPGEHRGVRALVAVGQAALLCERNEVEAALAEVQRGLDLLPWWDKADDFALAYATLARIRLARGEVAQADEALAEADCLLQARGVFAEARQAVAAARVRCWLAQGALVPAGRWAAARAADPFCPEDDLLHLARTRVLLAQGRPEEALDLLAPLAAYASPAGPNGRLLEILLLQALALQASGRAGEAQTALGQSLALAQGEGFARVFLDEGAPAQRLLARWADRAPGGAARAYAYQLLAQFEGEAGPLPAPTGGLIEPLSPRELEVLGLIALGRTNRAIAGELVVAVGTVKAHTSALYRKLEVANRTAAVARARELGIL